MIYLFLSIFCNALLFIILKYFERFRINNLQAIVINYLCACALGLLNNSCPLPFSSVPAAPWAPVAVVLGGMFIVVFLLIAKTAQEISVSAATVANKMSVIIPVTIAIIFYHNSFGLLKLIGIATALAAVFMASRKETEAGSIKEKSRMLILLPVIVFLGSGTADAFVNYAQEKLVPKEETSLFVASFFAVAGTIGICWITVRSVIRKERITFRSILGGIILGIPNYFSIYFMIKALNTHLFESSVLYPLNNMGIVLLSAAGGLLLLKEKLSPVNIAGVLLSIFSIALIAFS
jgi:drug/metabolite transporter (DMT)-like permease